MNEEDLGEFISSAREVSSFLLDLQVAKSKVDAAKILQDSNLSEETFTYRFPGLAKAVQELPDESSPSA
jgi:hypothetical protein